MFSRLSFRAKLLSLCLLLCSVSVVVGGVGYFGLREVNTQYHFVTEKVIPKTLLANNMFLEYRRVRITLRTLGMPGLSKEDAEHTIADASLAIEHYEQAKKEYLAFGFAPGQKEYWEKTDAAWTDFKAIGAKVIALYKSGKPDDFNKMLDIFFHECPEKAKVFTAAGEELLKFHRDLGAAKVSAANAASDQANLSSLLAIFIGLGGGLTVGYFFARSISNTIQTIVTHLNDNASQVASASAQIASSSEELSSASSEQAASLEQTASSLEEINSMIAKATDSAHSTASSAAGSKEKAERGRSAIDSMMGSISEISESNEAIMNQVNSSNQQMAEIVKVIQEIGNKTKVINEIVFQTKLLSFNASVEAARAGEHGKGFAVVAEEVGNLAQMSGNAAKEISEMLEGSISKVGNIVEETKSKVEMLIARGKEKVQAGQGIAHQCSDVLNDILNEVTKVSSLAQEISQASNEQAQGVTEINKAMRQLDTVTQQNSATSEEAASAAEELSAQAASMKSVVHELVKVINGAATHSAPRVAVPSTTNVVRIKPAPTRAETPRAPITKAVAGMPVPSSDNAGFEDI